jgi:hypothetical protein
MQVVRVLREGILALVEEEIIKIKDVNVLIYPISSKVVGENTY